MRRRGDRLLVQARRNLEVWPGSYFVKFSGFACAPLLKTRDMLSRGHAAFGTTPSCGKMATSGPSDSLTERKWLLSSKPKPESQCSRLGSLLHTRHWVINSFAQLKASAKKPSLPGSLLGGERCHRACVLVKGVWFVCQRSRV